MASSLANIPDHWLWLGLGVFTFIAVKQVSHGLNNIRSVTEIRNPTHPNHDLSERLPRDSTHQEDAIKTSSLLTLAISPNIDIRSSATKILCQRFYNSKSARKLLAKDLTSKDEDVRHRAQLAFDLLCAYGVFRETLRPPNRSRSGWRLHESDRPQEATSAADLRRRRREAVVIHDGEVDRPIGQEDVYMRDQSGHMSSDLPLIGEAVEDRLREVVLEMIAQRERRNQSSATT